MCVNTMPMGNNISNDIKQSGKGYTVISSLKSTIIEQGKLLMSRKHSRQLPVFPGVDIPVSDCAVLRETVKKTTKETPSNYISDSTCCSLLKVEVHDSTIKYGVFGRVAGESIFSLKMAAQLKFEQRILGRCNLDR